MKDSLHMARAAAQLPDFPDGGAIDLEPPNGSSGSATLTGVTNVAAGNSEF